MVKRAFLLALLTGRRREAADKKNLHGIIENSEGESLTIKVEDFKLNKIKKLTRKEEVKYIRTPAIAPNEKMQRDSIKDLISKTFTHYFNQLTGKKV